MDRRGRIHENDVKSLLGFRAYIDRTFSKNLVFGASVMTDRLGQYAREFSPLNLIDDSRSTYWMPFDGKLSSELTIDFRRNVDFNVIRLREFLPLGQRVESFAIDKWEDGKWLEFASATSIGNCRLIRTERTSTAKIRCELRKPPRLPHLLNSVSLPNRGAKYGG